MSLINLINLPEWQNEEQSTKERFSAALAAEIRLRLATAPKNPHKLTADDKRSGFLRGEILKDASKQAPPDHQSIRYFYAPFNIGFELTDNRSLLATLSKLAVDVCHHPTHIACISGSACFLRDKSAIADLDFSSYVDGDHDKACTDIAGWQAPASIESHRLKISKLGGSAVATYRPRQMGQAEWLRTNWPAQGKDGRALAVMRNFVCKSVGPLGNVPGSSFTVRVATQDGGSLLSHRYTEVLMSPPKAGFRDVGELRRYAKFLQEHIQRALKNGRQMRGATQKGQLKVAFSLLKGLKRAYALGMLIGLNRTPQLSQSFALLGAELNSRMSMAITRQTRKLAIRKKAVINNRLTIISENLEEQAALWRSILESFSGVFRDQLGPLARRDA